MFISDHDGRGRTPSLVRAVGIHGELDLYRNTERVEVTGYLTDLITEKSLSFVRKNAHRPFFLYVAYNAPPLALPATGQALRCAHSRYLA